MKKMIALAFLGFQMVAVSGAQADVVGPDEGYTTVQCHNTSGMTGGLSVAIKSGEFSGVDTAYLTNRDDIGPFIQLGSVVVHQQAVQPGVDGAPLVFLGENFELSINVDGAP